MSCFPSPRDHVAWKPVLVPASLVTSLTSMERPVEVKVIHLPSCSQNGPPSSGDNMLSPSRIYIDKWQKYETERCFVHAYKLTLFLNPDLLRAQELCGRRSGCPFFPSLTVGTVSVDVKQHWTPEWGLLTWYLYITSCSRLSAKPSLRPYELSIWPPWGTVLSTGER